MKAISNILDPIILKKRGKGSKSKKNTMVMTESVPLEDINSGKKSLQYRYYKRKFMNSHKKGRCEQNCC